MDPTADEVAGVVDLFGALGREELGEALAEVAFKQGADDGPEDFGDAIDAAIEDYHLVRAPPEAVVGTDEETLVVGPAAFPDPPAGAEDLPHIMDVSSRSVDREALAPVVEQRFRTDAAAAVDGTEARIAHLLDVSYELEVWGPVDLGELRSRLDAARAN
jgi:hypothetical protein